MELPSPPLCVLLYLVAQTCVSDGLVVVDSDEDGVIGVSQELVPVEWCNTNITPMTGWVSGGFDGILMQAKGLDLDIPRDINYPLHKLVFDLCGEVDGFTELAKLDDNYDGMLTDEEISDLYLWIDNGDGIMEGDEMVTMAETDYRIISCKASYVFDNEGNIHLQSMVESYDGSEIMMEDIFLTNDLGMLDE